ncbi:hypothetical protein ACFSCX_11085 [Bacillus salitolerans]|uniref:DUF1292 domain-containing protein n=1 Tax=Bacillus salitolerans TaxID=1437434 RepID=A0ABW4LSI1_9BACI
MSLEWFHRMENATRLGLPDLCETFDDFEIMFDTNTTTFHPEFVFSIQTLDDVEEFCIVNFDPNNQEFYSFYFHEEANIQSKVIFGDVDELLGFVHASFHEYVGDIDEEDLFEQDMDDLDEGLSEETLLYGDDQEIEYEELVHSDEDDLEELKEQVEWISNDKHIHIEDEDRDQYSIHLKLGKDIETGDGVLYRHTIMKHDDQDIEDEMIFYFKEDEASYIADLLNEYLGQRSH